MWDLKKKKTKLKESFTHSWPETNESILADVASFIKAGNTEVVTTASQCKLSVFKVLATFKAVCDSFHCLQGNFNHLHAGFLHHWRRGFKEKRLLVGQVSYKHIITEIFKAFQLEVSATFWERKPGQDKPEKKLLVSKLALFACDKHIEGAQWGFQFAIRLSERQTI